MISLIRIGVRGSQPARAVWIEMPNTFTTSYAGTSQPARAVWIEIDIAGYSGCNNLSQPARAVWIEIKQIPPFYKEYIVTACEGCVD